MKLVFYSDFVKEENIVLDTKIISLISNTKAKFAFVPSQTDTERKYFNEFVNYYTILGFTDFTYFDIDQEFDVNKMFDLLIFDVIFLSGGNTFYFLNTIKKHNLIWLLREFANTPSKILIGVSAGAIIMTPTIMSTVIQHQIIGDFEELNKVRLMDFSSLSLVDFQFIPHFSTEYINDKFREYSLISKSNIYGCPNGSGIIINGNNLTKVGEVTILK